MWRCARFKSIKSNRIRAKANIYCWRLSAAYGRLSNLNNKIKQRQRQQQQPRSNPHRQTRTMTKWWRRRPLPSPIMWWWWWWWWCWLVVSVSAPLIRRVISFADDTENDELVIKHLHFELLHAISLIMLYLPLRYSTSKCGTRKLTCHKEKLAEKWNHAAILQR